MKSRLATVLLVLGLVAFGSVSAVAAVSHVRAAGAKHAKKGKRGKALATKAVKGKVKPVALTGAAAPATAGGGEGAAPEAAVEVVAIEPSVAAAGDSRDASAKEYGTRPGKGCGDRNHTHTGPPGNPSNTDCPPDAGGHGRDASEHEYGVRPGKGCGDRNHTHTGPPGNPANTACPKP